MIESTTCASELSSYGSLTSAIGRSFGEVSENDARAWGAKNTMARAQTLELETRIFKKKSWMGLRPGF